MRALLLLLIGLAAASGCIPAAPNRQTRSAESPRSRPGARTPSEPHRPDLNADDLARRIHRATNAERQRRGAATLRWDADLLPVARGHSRDMARRGFFDHVTPDGVSPNERAARAGVSCEAALLPTRSRVGVLENLYKTSRWTEWTERTIGGRTTRDYVWQTPDAIVRAVVNGWMNSPGHRRNLLDATARGQAIAVAFARDDSVYITQVLC